MSNVVNLENEVWKIIDHPSIGYYPNYMVSNKGRVKSLNYLGSPGEERILKPRNNKSYFYVALCRKGEKQKNFSVHRLVAFSFLENPENLPCVTHKDENPSNNCVENLEWCTQQYNRCYGTSIQRMKETRKTSIAFKEGIEKRKETLKNSTAWKEAIERINSKKRKKIYQYTTNGLVKIYSSATEVERLTAFDSSSISRCCKGKQKTSYNYIWSYEELSIKEVLDLFERAKLGKTVYQYTLNLQPVNVYSSVKEASKQTKINKSCINACCNGKQKTAGGYIFTYESLTNSTNQLTLFLF